MNGEIICVGTELLLGDIVNTNARFLSLELASLGINVYNQSVVGDNAKRIKGALSEALLRSEVIIFTGGLGPTEDDMTKESIAEYFSLPLIEDSESRKHIEDYFRRTGRVPAAGNFKQALCPRGAKILKNDVGTAPGYVIESGNSIVAILPGPPAEMQHMFSNYLLPYLKAKQDSIIVSHNVHIFGEMESAIEEKIKDLTKLENPTIAPYAKEGEVRLRVTAKASIVPEADALCKPVIDSVSSIIGDSVYGLDCGSIQQVVVKLLADKKLKIATAESCTAGMLSAMITEVPGSSSVFDLGISAYANHIKTAALGVPEHVIKKHGAVSEHTAAYMALGVRKISGADIGIGITGVAGPGASEHKPVGLVYIALADKENVWIRKTTLGHGSAEREKVRRNSAKTALDLVRRYILSLPKVMPGGFKIGGTPVVLQAQPSIARNSAPRITKDFSKSSVHHVNKHASVLSDREIAEFMGAVANSEYKRNDYSMPTATYEETDFLAHPIEADNTPSVGTPEYEKLFKAHPDHALEYTTGSETASEAASDIANAEEIKKPKKISFTIPKGVISFLKSFFPYKGDSLREIIRKLVFLISIIALFISATYMISYFGESNSHSALLEETKEIFDETVSVKNETGAFSRFDPLLAKNPDTKGWITIPGTPVDNPIVQCDDNDFYLTHDFDKKKSRYGTLFIEAENSVTEKKISQNLVIYGHEMRDGAMFGSLKKYRNVNFYKENPVFSMDTLYNSGEYKIFAIIITNSLPEHDNGTVFEYRYSSFATQARFLDWIDDVKERSIINTGVNVRENDSIVTLSTCCTDFDNARLVIFGRKVRKGESSSIDLEKVSVNNTPRYPQIYYDKKGVENPFAKEEQKVESKPASTAPTSSVTVPSTSSDTTSNSSVMTPSVSSDTAPLSSITDVSSELIISSQPASADNVSSATISQ